MSFLHKVKQVLDRPFPSARAKKFKTLAQQLNEYYGEGDFHCKEHAELAESLRATGHSFRVATSVEDKLQVAKAELALWHKYIGVRTEARPEEFVLKERTIANFRRIWDQLKDKGSENLSCSKALDLFLEYIDRFPFDINVDKVCISEMIHPHFGYLTNMPGQVSFDQFIQLKSRKLLASYERHEGEGIFAKQLSALAYWELVDVNNTGALDLEGLNRLLKAFRLKEVFDLDDVKSHYWYTLSQLPNELDHLSAMPFVRFEFFRRLFVERNF